MHGSNERRRCTGKRHGFAGWTVADRPVRAVPASPSTARRSSMWVGAMIQCGGCARRRCRASGRLLRVASISPMPGTPPAAVPARQGAPASRVPKGSIAGTTREFDGQCEHARDHICPAIAAVAAVQRAQQRLAVDELAPSARPRPGWPDRRGALHPGVGPAPIRARCDRRSAAEGAAERAAMHDWCPRDVAGVEGYAARHRRSVRVRNSAGPSALTGRRPRNSSAAQVEATEAGEAELVGA